MILSVRKDLAAVPPVRAVRGSQAYPGISRQRHLLARWQAAMRQAGLQAGRVRALTMGGGRQRGTLRGLAFWRVGDPGGAT
jgi:hypothetical protein